MNTKRRGALLLTALLACGARSAKAGPLEDVVAQWPSNPTTNMTPADTWDHLTFDDENGKSHLMYFRSGDLKSRANQSGLSIPLFVLDPSPEKTKFRNEITVKESRYERPSSSCMFHCETKFIVEQVKRTVDVQVATFRHNKLSVYQITGFVPSFPDDPHSHGDFVISRTDKPELRLAGHQYSAIGYWYDHDQDYPGLYDWVNDQISEWDYIEWDAVHNLWKTVVLAPEGTDGAESSPMTGSLSCRDLSAYYKAPGTKDITQQIVMGFTPIEQELRAVQAEADSSSDLYARAVSDIQAGRFDGANAYLQAARVKLSAFAKGLSGQLKSAPAERFLPLESKFLSCRMTHVGSAAEKDFFAQVAKDAALSDSSARLAAQKGFVQKWRRFAAKELDRYVNEESPGIPKLPQDLKLKDRDEALAKRTTDAIAGRGDAAPAEKPAAPRVGPGQQQKVDRTVDDILGR